MSEIKGKIELNLEVTLKLNENEARALYALTAYGTEEFLNVFYNHLGKTPLKPYEVALQSLFEHINYTFPTMLRKMDQAKKEAVICEL